MKRLNNKGYMLVEIILASVIAFVMAFFLLDITVKLINKNNDYYTSSKLLSDRNIITKEIMDYINSGNLIMVKQESDDTYTFVFDNNEEIVLKIDSETKTITYGDYQKSLSNKLSFDKVILENNSVAKVFTFILPAYTAYSNINYGLNIIIPYKGELEIKLPENCKNITVKYGSTSTIYTDTAVTLNYDENISEYEVSVSGGEYILESWGAQGGNSSKYSGGLGGFINGKLKLTGSSTLKVKVGGQDGTNGGGASIGEGSYNGGGATTVSLNNSIIMTAGGGSGANDNYDGNAGGSGDGTGARNGTNGGGGSSEAFYDNGGTDEWYCATDFPEYCSISDNRENNKMWCYCSVEIGAGNSAPAGYTCGSADKYGYKTCEKDFAARYDENETSVGIGNGGKSSVDISLITDSNKSDGVNKGNGKFTISCANTSEKPSAEYPTEGNIVTDTVLKNNMSSEVVYNYTDINSSCEPTEVTLTSGEYLLEVWGAQGGYYRGEGGKGGYSTGILTLNEETKVYVNIGGQSTLESYERCNDDDECTKKYRLSTGCNGAGDGGYTYNSYYNFLWVGMGGGGASDIRIGTNSLYARVIVAGGGSGAYYDGTSYEGAYGGGRTGGTAIAEIDDGINRGILGGTQTSAGTNGSFGTGASSQKYEVDERNSPGGGGGFYGGGSTMDDDDAYGDMVAISGGGSGYVYIVDTASNYPSGCLLNSTYYLTDAETITGDETFTDFDGTNVKGHSGDGAVRITALPKYLIPRIIFDKDVITISYGTLVNLDIGVSYKCEDSSPNGCTYLGTGITDTSSIERGTYYLSYKIKASDGKIYTYVRKLVVN